MRIHATQIYTSAIEKCMPQKAVERALESIPKTRGRLITVAIGKAAWEMAHTASEILGERIFRGIVITKYRHAKGDIPSFEIYEAGHPVPDENSFSATARALELTGSLTEDDTVLFLVSGGGSALFENTDCSLEELAKVTGALLSRGASIEEINTVRKHLSNVKGGRFALHCAPALVYTVVLSDVLGDRLDTIASGPSAPDTSTVADTARIASAYALPLSEHLKSLLLRETPKVIDNASYFIAGSVRELCRAAADTAKALGYDTTYLTDQLTCEAAEAGAFLASIARSHADTDRPLAFVAGGETVVHLRGTGLGGRNQELALSAAIGLEGISNACVFSVGSDGTDGPCDAAGGYADGGTVARLAALGIDARAALADNDSYHALGAIDSLIFTGPTGTNVNDVAVVLIQPKHT